MSAQEMVDWFKVVQDQYGSPYFTDDEYLTFLNRAQIEYVNKLFPDNEGGNINIEWDWNVLQNIQPLIFELPADVMDTTGKITNAEVRAALVTASGDSTANVVKILSVEYKKGVKRFPCKVLRHNDKAAFEQNYFKKPGQFNPRYLLQNNNLQFRPIDVNTQIYITVVKTPKDINLDDPSHCELPISTHNEIVAYGLEFAGIASRDEVLTAMNKMQLPQ